jgi:hypothetical protein
MTLVAIESPYAGSLEEIERNLRYLRAAMADCFSLGEAPYASHGLYTQPGVLRDEVPGEREQGIAAGFSWAALAAKRVFYTDLGWSPGMDRGLKEALRLGQTIETRKVKGWA